MKMGNPMQQLLTCFALLLSFKSYFFSPSYARPTLSTTSKEQVECQMCTECDNPCPPEYYPPPPPPVIICPPPPPPPSPPPPSPELPICPPPPPPACPECPPCEVCENPPDSPTVKPYPPKKPEPMNGQPAGVISGAIFSPPNPNQAVPYFSYPNNNPAAGTSSTSASTSVHPKLKVPVVRSTASLLAFAALFLF